MKWGGGKIARIGPSMNGIQTKNNAIAVWCMDQVCKFSKVIAFLCLCQYDKFCSVRFLGPNSHDVYDSF